MHAALALAIAGAASAAATAPSSPTPAAETPPSTARVVARVNGESLFAEDLERVLGQLHDAPEIARRGDYDVDRLLARVVNDTLIAQEARALGLDESVELAARLTARREAIARDRCYREEVLDRLDLGEATLRAGDVDLSRSATLEMLSRSEREEVEALRARMIAARDPEIFAQLVREHSQDAYRGRGGRLEHVPLHDLYSTIAEFARTAGDGEVSPAVPTPWGWSLLRLVKLEDADPEQFPARRGRITREVRNRQERALREALSARLRAEHAVEVDHQALAAIGCRRMHDGRLLPEAAAPESTLASVAGRSLAVSDYLGRLAEAWSGLGNVEIALERKPAVLERLILDELVTVEGLRRGYAATPEVDRRIHALEVELLVRSFLEEVVAAHVEVAAEEAESWYAGHRGRYRKPPLLHVSQISVATEAEAEEVAALARSGVDFAWLARRRSRDDFAPKGGDRGWMPANKALPLFRRELAAAAAGDVLGPRQSGDAWVIARVGVVEDRGVYEFAEVSGNVRQQLLERKLAERLDDTITRLRERSEISIDVDAVAALSIAPTAPRERSEVPGHER